MHTARCCTFKHSVEQENIAGNTVRCRLGGTAAAMAKMEVEKKTHNHATRCRFLACDPSPPKSPPYRLAFDDVPSPLPPCPGPNGRFFFSF